MRGFLNRKVFTILLTSAGLMGAALHALPAEDNSYREVAGALLNTTIHASPVKSPRENQGRIQPGTRVKLTATVKNMGDVPSAPGKIFLRFAFPKPLNREPTSVIFETDPEGLPSIPPGETLTINFKNVHQWPSLFDYIRHDWAMREYEAVVAIKDKEYITGTRAISFSAYYYEGHEEKEPVRVSSADHIRETPRKSTRRNSSRL